MNTKKQRHLILTLLAKKPVTTRYLVSEKSILSPTKRISELRKQGNNIKDKWVKTEDSRYKVYWLEVA